MKAARRGTAPASLPVSVTLDHQELAALLNGLKAARGKGLNLDTTTSRRPNSIEADERSSGEIQTSTAADLSEAANERPHTIDHVNCQDARRSMN